MIPFLVIALAMLAVACAWVLVPLLSRRASTTIDGEASNLSVLRDQRAELEGDLANGVLSSEQYEAARGELDRRVLEEAGGTASAAIASRGSAWTAALIGAGFPIGAVMLYLVLGTPVALLPGLSQSAREDGKPGVSAPEIEAMIQRVKERLAAKPDDLEGWSVLARTYHTLGRATEAAATYERAVALAPNDADLLADYADAIAVTQGRALEGKPEELVARALRANPGHWKANALAGSIAFKRGSYAKAVEHWERVRAAVPADSPMIQTIESSLAEARSLAGAPKEPLPSGAKVAGTVRLDPALASGAALDDTVFVFARPTDGSRMPVALLRVKVRDLPFAFTLDDSTAMMPNRKLSDHAEVFVGARVSKSGNATPQPGDLEATSPPVKAGAKDVKLVIDRKLP